MAENPDQRISEYLDDLFSESLPSSDEGSLNHVQSSSAMNVVNEPLVTESESSTPQSFTPDPLPKAPEFSVPELDTQANTTEDTGLQVSIPAHKNLPLTEQLLEIPDRHKLEKLLETTQAQVMAAENTQSIATVAKIVTEEPLIQPLADEASNTHSIEPNDEACVEFDKIEQYQWLDNGLPQWAQSRFDILLINVAGLSLAVPLVALGSIQPLSDDITPLFGQTDWFMGLQKGTHGKVSVVNTAKFVMPERYKPEFEQGYEYVVSINELPWALAVDSIGQPISVMPDEVRWRSERTTRAWLAGTIKAHMCALIDIPALGHLLSSEQKVTKR